MPKKSEEEERGEERTVFLEDVATGTMEFKTRDENRYTDSFRKTPFALIGRESPRPQTKSRCRCCSCKCCGITTAVVVGVIAAVILGLYLWFRSKVEAASEGGASTKDNELWARRLENLTDDVPASQEMITGVYQLVSYDKGYEDYLKAFDTPSFIVSLVMDAWETQEWSGPDENGKIAVQTLTGFSEKEMEFRLGEEFQLEWGKGKGVMHTICRQPEPNIINCASLEKQRNWSLTSENRFSRGGMVNLRRFLNKNVEATKYFKREGIDFNDTVIERDRDDEIELVKVEQPQDSQSPFSSDESQWDVFEEEGDEWAFSTDD